MSYIFIGNTVKRLNLTANKIYKDLPTDEIKELESRGLSLIKQLFVEPARLNKAKIEMNERGTALYEARRQLKYFMGSQKSLQ